MKPYALAAGAAVAIVLTSCGSSSTTSSSSTPSTTSSSPSATSPAPAASGGIVISNFIYTGTLTVKPGEKVNVTNKDAKPHTVTDKAGKFDSGNIPADGGTGTFTAPTAPGTYNLICKYHPRMAGKLTVQG
jgi:plastocyanin